MTRANLRTQSSSRLTYSSSLAVVLSLTLGIAGATVVYEVSHRTLLPQGLSGGVPLVELMQWNPGLGVRMEPTPEILQEWKQTLRSFDVISGFVREEASLRDPEGARAVATARVDPDFFALLGQPPRVGRAFGRADLAEGDTVVLISRRLALERFGSERSALRKRLILGGDLVSIIGVLPPNLEQAILSPGRIDIVRPLGPARPETLEVLARRKPNLSLAQVKLELETWSKAQPPQRTDGGRLRWVALSPVDRLDSATLRLLAAAALGALVLLLVTGSNVAHLLAAEAEARRREVATRWALGATRSTLVGWKTKRSFFLSLPAALGATALANGVLHGLRGLLPESLRFLGEAQVSAGSLVFALAASFLTLFGFDALPSALRDGGVLRRDLSADPRLGRPSALGNLLGSAHIVSIVAGSFILAVLASLLVATLVALERGNLGFEMDGLQVISAQLPEWKYKDAVSREGFAARAFERLSSMPGVNAVSFASSVPPQSGLFLGRVELGNGAALQGVGRVAVGPGYFRTLQQEIVAGREFEYADLRSAAKAVVISESFAEALAGVPQAALGRQIRFDADVREVIGVARDLRVPSFIRMPGYQTYWPLTRLRSSLNLLVRTRGAPSGDLRRAISTLDPDVVVDAAPTRELFARSLEGTRFLMRLFAFLTALAIGLALAGVYGVLTRFANHQRGQIALRLALGATQEQVRHWVAGRGLTRAAAGVAVGFVASYPASRVLAAQLYGLEPTSAWTRLAVAFALLIASVLAIWPPALRASRVDPNELLREA